jgi:hypothetical protein
MDAYNQGYGAGIENIGQQVGSATVLNPINLGISASDLQDWQAAGFYAVAYDLEGQTIISYRGTDASALAEFFGFPGGGIDGVGDDAITGYPVALGSYVAEQAQLAAEFYQSVTGTETGDPRTGNAILTGHSGHAEHSQRWAA